MPPFLWELDLHYVHWGSETSVLSVFDEAKLLEDTLMPQDTFALCHIRASLLFTFFPAGRVLPSVFLLLSHLLEICSVLNWTAAAELVCGVSFKGHWLMLMCQDLASQVLAACARLWQMCGGKKKRTVWMFKWWCMSQLHLTRQAGVN